MSSLLALVRLARRDARRDGWRTLLVVVTVALPVAGLVGAVGFVDTMEPSAEETVVGRLGAADAEVRPWVAMDDPVGELGARVPTDTRLEPISRVTVELRHEGRSRTLLLSDTRMDEDALAAGQVELLEGRSAADGDEVVVTSAVADELGLAMGDTVDIAGRQRQVVGLAERSERLAGLEAFTTSDGVTDAVVEEILVAMPDGVVFDLPGDDVQSEFTEGTSDVEPTWMVVTREELGASRFGGGERVVLSLMGGLAAVEVALIAGAAFAVSVRRRQRELGLLAAVGGTGKHLRRTVLLTGGVAGVVGSAVGVLLGAGALLLAGPWLDQLADRRTGGVTLDVTWLLVAAGIGLAAALAGAWWPARSVARLPVLLALAGRRPTPRPSVRGVRAGLMLVVVGMIVLAGAAFLSTVAGSSVQVLLTTALLLGCVLVVLGAGLTSPWLLERIGRLAPRLPVGARLALRDAARFRTRNGPLVTAAMAALAACVTVGAVVGSLDAESRAAHQPILATDQLLISGSGTEAATPAVAQVLDAEPIDLPWLPIEAQTDEGDHLLATVGSSAAAEALGGPAASDAFDAGRAVVIGVDTNEVTLVEYDETGEETELLELTVEPVPSPGAEPSPAVLLPELLIPREVIDDLGLELDTQDRRSLFVLDRDVDAELERRAADAARQVVGGDVFVEAELGYRSSTRNLRVVAIAVGSLAGLAIVSVAIALAATEGRRDLRTLTSVGASGRTRRSLAAGRALVLAGLAGALAIPVGMVPAVILMGFVVDDLSIHVPWVVFAIVAIGVPLLAVAGSVAAALRPPDRLSRAA